MDIDQIIAESREVEEGAEAVDLSRRQHIGDIIIYYLRF